MMPCLVPFNNTNVPANGWIMHKQILFNIDQIGIDYGIILTDAAGTTLY